MTEITDATLQTWVTRESMPLASWWLALPHQLPSPLSCQVCPAHQPPPASTLPQDFKSQNLGFLAPQRPLQLTLKNFPTLNTLYALKPGLWLRGSKDLRVSERSPLFSRCSSEFSRRRSLGAQSLHPKALLNNYLLTTNL